MHKNRIYAIALTMLALGLSTLAVNIPKAEAAGLIGDVDGDGKVNMKDMYLASLAFGSSVGDSNYNPAADINHNGGVDSLDLYLIAIHFGESISQITIEATVKIFPRVLNLRSDGRWIMAAIKLPKGYDVHDIDVSTLRLNGTIPATRTRVVAEDCDDDHEAGVLLAKFSRAEVIQLVRGSTGTSEKFMKITLTVTGMLNDGTPFLGSDTIRIVRFTCDRD